MKRSRMPPRKYPMSRVRKPLRARASKRVREDRADRAALAAFAESHDCCAICICRNRKLDIHHINTRIGSNRNRESNLAMLCRRCHDCLHKGAQTYGDECWPNLKKSHLLFVLGLPACGKYEPEPLPSFYIEQRRINGGDRWPTH